MTYTIVDDDNNIIQVRATCRDQADLQELIDKLTDKRMRLIEKQLEKNRERQTNPD